MLPEAENILSDAVEDAVIQKYFCTSSANKVREELYSFHHCRISTLCGCLGLPKKQAISISIGGFSTTVSLWLSVVTECLHHDIQCINFNVIKKALNPSKEL